MEKDNRALTAIEGLWQALWNSPPPHEVLKVLERNEAVRVKHFTPHSAQEVVVELGEWKESEERYLHLQADRTPRKFYFVALGQGVLLEMEGLVARWGRVFIEVRSLLRLKKVLEEVRLLGSLFSSMGLGDLEEALEALATMEDGEARMKGPYVLIRKGSLLVLRHGTLFGDPILDCKFMAGDEVALSYPGGVVISLKGDLRGGWMKIQEGYIRWESEVSQLYCAGASQLVNEGALQELLRCGLLGALDRTKSLKMRTLIEELLEEEDPLVALRKDDFIERVEMSVLAKF